MLPRTLAWLEPNDELAAQCTAEGVSLEGSIARSRFEAKVSQLLAMIDRDISTLAAERSDWDPTRARGPGAPADEAVVRARGDLNRALFVE